MSKDPAVLFYTSDFISGTLTMSDAQRGKYIILLCLQHQQGLLSEDDMMNICKTYDEKIFKKFIKTEAGFYYNERMKTETDRRKKYSESRSNNRKNISKSYVNHMETETITINNNKKKSIFIIPTIEEIKAKMIERNLTKFTAEAFHAHYTANGWMVGKNKMKDWNSALTTWDIKSKEYGANSGSNKIDPKRTNSYWD